MPNDTATRERIERKIDEHFRPSDYESMDAYVKACSNCRSALTALCEEMERDTERLDWLISRGAYLSLSRDGDVCNVWYSHDPDDDSNGAVPVEGYPQKCHNTAREAIDAAMRFTNDKTLPQPPAT